MEREQGRLIGGRKGAIYRANLAAALIGGFLAAVEDGGGGRRRGRGLGEDLGHPSTADLGPPYPLASSYLRQASPRCHLVCSCQLLITRRRFLRLFVWELRFRVAIRARRRGARPGGAPTSDLWTCGGVARRTAFASAAEAVEVAVAAEVGLAPNFSARRLCWGPSTRDVGSEHAVMLTVRSCSCSCSLCVRRRSANAARYVCPFGKIDELNTGCCLPFLRELHQTPDLMPPSSPPPVSCNLVISLRPPCVRGPGFSCSTAAPSSATSRW